MFRKIAITLLGTATLLGGSVPALAMPRGNGLPIIKNESVQLARHRRTRGNYWYGHSGYRRSGYGHYGHRHSHNSGAAALVGIIGLGAALAIASAQRNNAHTNVYQSGSPEWIAACARKYRSFEPHTGLYTTYGGVKKRCQLP